jgi:hypothetical protein
VVVGHPRPGGSQRVCVQPGSVVPFEFAERYSKASGFLTEQKVDIPIKIDPVTNKRVFLRDVAVLKETALVQTNIVRVDGRRQVSATTCRR